MKNYKFLAGTLLALSTMLTVRLQTANAQSTSASSVAIAPKAVESADKDKKPEAKTTAVTPAAVVPKTSPAPAPIKLGSVVISGSVRARLESWDWFDAGTADDKYSFGAATLRLAISQSKEKFEWMIEGAAPVLFNLPDHAIAPGAQGQLGQGASYFAPNGKRDGSVILKQANVRFKGLFGNAPSSLKVGRFEFSDGAEMAPADPTLAALKRDRIAQRLIGSFGFTHIGRSFDGVVYAHQKKTSNFTFVAARPTAGVFDLNANKELEVDFWYGAFTKPLKFKSGAGEYRLFALHYHDGREVVKTDNRALAVRQADKQNLRITSLGGHYIGAYKAGGGKVDVLAWGVGQFGNWGTLGHRAGAVALEAGFQPGGKTATRIKPWIRAGYFRSTGDNDPTDNTHGSFFQALPTPRIYARFPIFNLMNNEDVFAELMLKPHAKLSIRTDVHHLRLSSAKDLWYMGGGAFQKGSFGYVGRPSNGEKTLGTMVDFSADYLVGPRTTLTFYIANIQGGGVAARIYPTGSSSRLAYVEFTQKF